MVVLQFSLLATIMSVHHSLLGVNVRCHLICLFFWLPMFLLLWEITNLPLTSLLSMVLEHPPFLPWWYRWGAVDHLSSRLISDHPHHHLVPGATCSVWVWGTLTPKRIHPRIPAFSFILPLSFEHFFFRTAYSLLVCVCLSYFLPVFLAVSAAGMLGMYLLHRCHVSEWRLLSIWMTCQAGML